MKNIFWLLTLITTLFSVCLPSKADAPNHYVKHLDVMDGLSQTYITSSLVDHKGTLWIGTKCRLNRYDGHRFLVYDSPDLDGDYIYSIYEDTSNRLWVATDAGLSKYDSWSDSFTKVSEKRIKKIFEFDGKTFFTSNDMLLVSDGLHLSEIQAPGLNWVVEVLTVEDKVFIVSDYELFIFDGKNIRSINIDYLGGNIISATLFKDQIWLGLYQKGLISLDFDGHVINKYINPSDKISIDVICAMTPDLTGEALWLGTDGSGLCLLDSKGIHKISELEGYSGSEELPNTIVSLAYDSFDNLWAGSSIDGIYCIKKSYVRFFKEGPETLSYRTITSIWNDGEWIWLGTDGGGIERYSPKDCQFKRFLSTQDKKVSSICNYNASQLLVSIYGQGLFLFDKKSGRMKEFVIWDEPTMEQERLSGNIITTFPTTDGRFFIFAKSSYLLDPTSGKCEKLLSESEESSTRLCFWKSGEAYAVGGSTLNKINMATGIITPIKTSNEHGLIYSAALFDGVIWLACNNGLFRISTDGETCERVMSDLFKHVTFLTKDESGLLWIAADGILFCYDGHTFKVLDEAAGFISNEILCGVSSEGSLCLGGTKGLSQVNITDWSQSDIDLKMTLEKVVVDGHVLREKNGVYLYSGHPAEIHVSYALLGADPFKKRFFKFVVNRKGLKYETSGPELKIQSPKNGTYNIEAYFLSPDGRWNASIDSLTVVITQPLFARWWFWLLIAVILATFTVLMKRFIGKKPNTIMLRPDIPVLDSSLKWSDEKILTRFDELLEERVGSEDLDVGILVREMGMSRTSLYAKIKSLTGLGIGEYIIKVKMEKAGKYLSGTKMTIAEISDHLGFSSPQYFSAAFKRAIGSSPREYRKKLKKTDDVNSIADSSSVS